MLRAAWFPAPALTDSVNILFIAEIWKLLMWFSPRCRRFLAALQGLSCSPAAVLQLCHQIQIETYRHFYKIQSLRKLERAMMSWKKTPVVTELNVNVCIVPG